VGTGTAEFERYGAANAAGSPGHEGNAIFEREGQGACSQPVSASSDNC
jgi:hypothetical protein